MTFLGARSNPRWRRRHEGVLLYLLKHPSARRGECAAATGYSKWQISRITNSAEFRDRLNDAYRDACLKAVRRIDDE